MGSTSYTPIRHRTVIAVLFSAWLLWGCGGGTSSAVAPDTPPVVDNPAPQSTVFVGLTDAEGDFLQYKVTVSSVTLTRDNGVVVETLPLSTEVDFAQYTEVTEFLTAATVPVGKYVAASITLDYSDALVEVEDPDGDPTEVLVLDESGAPAGIVNLSVEFADLDGFRIASGVPAHVTLDFDLESSHELNLAVMPAEAMLSGVLLADPILEDPKTRRARGLLKEVRVDQQQFDLDLRPFYRQTGRFGTLSVNVNADTEYEINGVTYSGTDGLLALAGEPVDTPVVTTGTLNIAERQYLAHVVYAGSSVPFGTRDVATGTVIARSGDELILHGAVLVRRDFRLRRVNRLAVDISDTTRVTQVKSSFAPFVPADISVGQRVTVIGELTISSTDTVRLDATDGHARLLFSQIHALVSEAGPLVVDLSSINRIGSWRFDFAGTGSSENADPEAYEVDTGALPLAGIDILDAIKIRGFAAPFGTAPADFLAQTLGEVSALPGRTWIRWSPGASDGALLSANADGMMIDISSAGRAVHLFSGAIAFDMHTAGEVWSVAPGDSGRGVFSIVTGDSRQVFTHFGEFVDALLVQINDNQQLVGLRSTDILNAQLLTSATRKLVVYLR